MAQSTASFFTDPTDVQTALGEHCQVGFVVTGRGPFRARLIRITLTRLSLLSAEEWQSRVLFVRPPADRVIVLLPWGCEPSQRWAGIPLRPQEVLTIRSVPGVHGRTVDHCHSAAVVCSTDYLVRLGRRLVGPTFVVPPGVARWQPAPDALRALVGLFRAAIRVTASRLSAPTSPEAARGLEQETLEALAECLSIAPERPHRQQEQFQISLMARFAEILRLHSERLASSADLGRQLGVPARTLRACCHDHLGVAPGRYLQLYQLQQFHRGLRGADPGVTTVSVLARRHGIRQTSRLARSYRDLFGEPPSATLRHTAES